MFGRQVRQTTDAWRFSSDVIDIVCEALQHPDRPTPLRAYDQIQMHAGSMLLQAMLVQDYIKNRRVMFLGEGIMALVVGLLCSKRDYEKPDSMHVYDFDKRLLKFISDRANDWGLGDLITVCDPYYNVRNPVPEQDFGAFDVFYTNPPYGRHCDGNSANIFLGRCMEFQRTGKAWGCAILPFSHRPKAAWTRGVMGRIQAFLVAHGYAVSEMLRDIHLYALDDDPRLASSIVVIDRVEDRPPPFATPSANGARSRKLTDQEMERFYGRRTTEVPEYIGLDGVPRNRDGQPLAIPATGDAL